MKGKQLDGGRGWGYGCLWAACDSNLDSGSSQPFRCVPHPWMPSARLGHGGCLSQWTAHHWVVLRGQVLKTVISCWPFVRSAHRCLLYV